MTITPVDELLQHDHAGLFVTIDVAMEALNLSQRRAYELARAEGWRVARGVYPREYSFTDIRTTWKRRNPA